jgi:hypothetical protein
LHLHPCCCSPFREILVLVLVLVLLLVLLPFAECEGWRSNAREQQKGRRRREDASKRGSSRKEEEGERKLANEFINACEEEGAKNVRNDTLQERKPCVKARKSEKSKIGQTFVVVVVVVVVAIFFLDSKREKTNLDLKKRRR